MFSTTRTSWKNEWCDWNMGCQLAIQYKDAEISNTSHLNINYSEDPPATIRKVDNICIPNLIIYSRGMTG